MYTLLGLPEAQPDHAVRMARFASTCLNRVTALVESLEATLGPGVSLVSFLAQLYGAKIDHQVIRLTKCAHCVDFNLDWKSFFEIWYPFWTSYGWCVAW